MKHLGGIGVALDYVEWLPGATYLAVKTMVCGGDLGGEYTCGLPPRNKEIAMSSVCGVLLVQPQYIMGSVLAKYLVGNLAWVPPEGGILGTGGSGRWRGY